MTSVFPRTKSGGSLEKMLGLRLMIPTSMDQMF